jgi:ferrous iron transport protein B
MTMLLTSDAAGRSGAFAPGAEAVRRVVLVGGPNVGKSCLFTALTGHYVVVSNYPGTTVEISRARVALDGAEAEALDTPGLGSLRALQEEERVTQRALLEAAPDAVVHVVPATQLARGLALAVELLEADLPVVLCLSMMDEMEASGRHLDVGVLSRALGVPVCGTVATTGRGVEDLKRVLAGPVPRAAAPAVEYPPAAARFVAAFRPRLAALGTGPVAAGLLLLERDPVMEARAAAADPGLLPEAAAARAEAGAGCAASGCASCPFAEGPAGVGIRAARGAWASALAASVTRGETDAARLPGRGIDRLLLHPLGGYAVLAVLLYGLYLVVGVFGAGTVVDGIESVLFEEHLGPAVADAAARWIPWAPLRSLLVGENGIWTLGITYAVAIILPVVGLFYLCFGLLEDSGYLPRLGVLLHRSLARLGLGGQAAIPLILGLGCVTTATLATRALPTRRERLIAVLLLSLATPCAAQLGVVLAILSFSPWALVAWAGTIGLAFVLTGLAAGRGLPGASPTLLTELPPLRRPSLRHVARKSLARIRWYFLEILPFFLIASVILWGLDLAGLLPSVEASLRPLARLAGLPGEASRFLLFGFFRRDYGAAGLYDLAQAGALDVRQVVVSAVLITLFIPCIAQLMVLKREFGNAATAAIVGFVFAAAFGTAAGLNLALAAAGL